MSSKEEYEELVEGDKRLKRINDAIKLKKPDRVPILLMNHFFPAKYFGITNEDAFYDLDKWLNANDRFIEEFKPDLYFPPNAPVFAPGKVNEILGMQQVKWPGHGVAYNKSFQFVEDEYMLQEEYDLFIEDPSDFVFRKYLPRVFNNLDGFEMLPPLKTFMLGYVGASIISAFANPKVIESFEKFLEAAKKSAEWNIAYNEFHKKQLEKGYHAFNGATALAPFDVISDMLRGMRGSMLDMFRCPEKIIAAEDKILPCMIEVTIQNAKMSNNPRVFIPLHRGADGFMSNEQFEKFYWPYLKKLIMALIDADLIPCPLFEGKYDQRLEYLKELPKGKVLGIFDKSDIFKVKEELGDTMCIAGDMPASFLKVGPEEKIEEYTKKLINKVGKDGGFIMSSNTVLDDVEPELLKKWVEYTKKYGKY